MSKTPQVKIVNAETGEEIIRDASADEIKQIEKDTAEFAEQRALAEAKVQAKQAVLDKLGLSAEEVSALLG